MHREVSNGKISDVGRACGGNGEHLPKKIIIMHRRNRRRRGRPQPEMKSLYQDRRQ